MLANLPFIVTSVEALAMTGRTEINREEWTFCRGRISKKQELRNYPSSTSEGLFGSPVVGEVGGIRQQQQKLLC